MIQHLPHSHWLPAKHNVYVVAQMMSQIYMIREPTRKSPSTPSSRTIVLVACNRPWYLGLLAISVPSWTVMRNYIENDATVWHAYDANAIYPSVLPANLSLIKSNGCVANVETTPPLSPATRCSYLTPEKKDSGTLLVGVSRTSSAIWSSISLIQWDEG